MQEDPIEAQEHIEDEMEYIHVKCRRKLSGKVAYVDYKKQLTEVYSLILEYFSPVKLIPFDDMNCEKK